MKGKDGKKRGRRQREGEGDGSGERERRGRRGGRSVSDGCSREVKGSPPNDWSTSPPPGKKDLFSSN